MEYPGKHTAYLSAVDIRSNNIPLIGYCQHPKARVVPPLHLVTYAGFDIGRLMRPGLRELTHFSELADSSETKCQQLWVLVGFGFLFWERGVFWK